MRFRPCIDLHGGVVKQIVGSSLRPGAEPLTNFTSDRRPGDYAQLFARDGLAGGHVIMLGPGNESAAREALGAFPEGLQIGGGITPQNARGWLDAGAQRVIATSYVFEGARLAWPKLEQLAAVVGRERLVLDLSCSGASGRYIVMSERWQTATELAVEPEVLRSLAAFCSEFLVHAVDVEGKKQGPDLELVARLAEATPLPTTYAGGIRNLDDVAAIERRGQGRLDFTVGSALDLFGGDLPYRDLADWGA